MSCAIIAIGGRHQLRAGRPSCVRAPSQKAPPGGLKLALFELIIAGGLKAISFGRAPVKLDSRSALRMRRSQASLSRKTLA
jgi:hypothetical protein